MMQPNGPIGDVIRASDPILPPQPGPDLPSPPEPGPDMPPPMPGPDIPVPPPLEPGSPITSYQPGR